MGGDEVRERTEARRAAAYLRSATQDSSLGQQSAAIDEYARNHGFSIVRKFVDEGRSGRTVVGREAFQEMLGSVQNGRADFTAILVYDVSRWGRFQDPDESAHYEFLCKQAGVSVHYCSEQLDGESPASILKPLKRLLEGEYHRAISDALERCELELRDFAELLVRGECDVLLLYPKDRLDPAANAAVTKAFEHFGLRVYMHGVEVERRS